MPYFVAEELCFEAKWNPNCNHSQSRTVDEMCLRDSPQVPLSAEEAIAAEASLALYTKPVELYNVLALNAARNPPFLQRCLDYKIKAKNGKRIRMTISLSRSMNKGVQVYSILPLYVLFVTPVPGPAVRGHSAVYRCRTRAHILTCSSESEKNGSSRADFVLPELDKLLDESKRDNFFVLLVSCGNKRNSYIGGDLPNDHMNTSTPVVGGYCLWGKIPLESLCLSTENRASLKSENGAGMPSTVDMRSCFLESTSLEKEQCITFRTPDNPVTMQVRVNIFVQENGKDTSPYGSFTHSGVHASSLPYIMRLRAGNVVFNYMYHNNTLQKTEVTEDFSCPFCLVKCASFKGLKYHLCASHDLFNFEFWVTKEFQAVNISLKIDIGRSENVTGGVDPKLQTFYLCKKPLKRISKSSSQNAKHVRTSDPKMGSSENTRNGVLTSLLEKEINTSSFPVPVTTTSVDTEPSNLPLRIYDTDTRSSKKRDKNPKVFISETDLSSGNTAEGNRATNDSARKGIEHVTASPIVARRSVSSATTQPYADTECLRLASGRNLPPHTMLQFAKSRKLSADRSHPRMRLLLQKRQFFHSHRAQPMALEQVFSDHDSEDEVDDDIADYEDKRMLDEFVDITKDEKRIMHLWNSFVRKQRVLADGHVPWACEAFAKSNRDELVQSSGLLWCWKLLLVKLWNHSLIDAITIDKCNRLVSIAMNASKAKEDTVPDCSHDGKSIV